jgi:hypothetical protein
MSITITEKPRTAFILSLIGGITVSLAGFFLMIIRYVRGTNIGLFGGTAGFLGIIWGTLIIVGAAMLYSRPQQHTTWSIIVLVFSLLSWIGALGGLIIGFVLGVTGGILGITWKPSAHTLPSPSSPTTRTCPNCGGIIYTDAKYCPKCGKELP